MFFLLSLIVVGLYLLYKLSSYYMNRNNDYWPKKGVPLALSTDFASYYQLLTGKAKFQDVDVLCYNKYSAQDAPFVGLMEMSTPVIQIRDLDLIKRIYVKDFDSFSNRRNISFSDDLNDSFLFNTQNQQWKELRSLMTPTFTTGKIRRMFEHFDRSGQNLIKYVQIQNEKEDYKNGIDLSELFGKYALDVISSTAFGMDSQCLLNDDSPFLKMAKKFQEAGFARSIKFFMVVFVPALANLIGLSFFNNEAMGFFKNVIKNNIKHRQEESSGDNHFHHSADFLDIMLEAREEPTTNKNNAKPEELDAFEKDAQLKNSGHSSTKISDKIILANSVTFFLAGFDTSEALMSFMVYHLAIHPEMQERLRNEILSCTQDCEGQITYEAVNKMTYLEMFLSENLRLYPPATRTERVVTKPYQIPETELILPVGLIVAIPILGIHGDSKHFPDPEKFDPERFSPENKAKRHPYAFMPFGHGPRSCIGLRFAIFEAKAAIAHLVANFEISPCAETFVPMKLANITANLKPAKGLKVAFKPLSPK